jgi:hypothetical protein
VARRAPYPWLIGAFTALVNPLPYLGTVLSVGVAAIVSIANGQPFRQIGWIVAVYVIIRILDDLVVAAVTIGGSVHMHPMLVMVSILVGEQTLGLLGMVAAVPLVTVVKETRGCSSDTTELPAPAGPAGGQIPKYICISGCPLLLGQADIGSRLCDASPLVGSSTPRSPPSWARRRSVSGRCSAHGTAARSRSRGRAEQAWKPRS